MSKRLGLFFAVVGTVLLAAISYFMSAGRPWMAVLFGIISLVFIGSGFAVKAKQRKSKE